MADGFYLISKHYMPLYGKGTHEHQCIIKLDIFQILAGLHYNIIIAYRLVHYHLYHRNCVYSNNIPLPSLSAKMRS